MSNPIPAPLFVLVSACTPLEGVTELEPWQAESKEAVLDAYGASRLNDLAPFAVLQYAYRDAQEGDCPELAESDGSLEISTQGCTSTSGFTWSGDAHVTFTGPDDEDWAVRFDAFELVAERGGEVHRYALHGISSVEQTDGVNQYEHALDYEESGAYDGEPYAIAGYWDRSVSGSWDAYRVRSDVGLRASLEGVTGQLRLDEDLDYGDDDCIHEPDGRSTLTGATIATLDWTIASCDGCAEVSLDGDDEGTACW